MRSIHSPVSRAALLMLAVVLVSGSGCSWLRSKFGGNDNYQRSRVSNPLEVPPDLDRPANPGVMPVPAAGGSQATATTAVSGFDLGDDAVSAWGRIGVALERIDGVTINARSGAISSYDVSYLGSSFLVRVQPSGNGSRVFALSPEGQLIGQGPAAELLGKLQARLN